MRQKSNNRTLIKESVVRLRVTEEEALLFKEKARMLGYKNVSQYIRAMCLNSYNDEAIMQRIQHDKERSK